MLHGKRPAESPERRLDNRDRCSFIGYSLGALRHQPQARRLATVGDRQRLNQIEYAAAAESLACFERMHSGGSERPDVETP
jgi:hypothetical protein